MSVQAGNAVDADSGEHRQRVGGRRRFEIGEEVIGGFGHLPDDGFDFEERLIERQRAAGFGQDGDAVDGIDIAGGPVHGRDIEGVRRAQIVVETEGFGGDLIFAADVAGLEEEAARGHARFALEAPLGGEPPGLIDGAGRDRAARRLRRQESGHDLHADRQGRGIRRLQILQRKLIPIELRRFGTRGIAEFHGDGGDGEIHFDDAVQRRSIDVKLRAERDADRDVDAAEEADFDPEARADFDADDDVVVEGVPGDQEIAVGGEPELDPVRPVCRFHAGAGHHAGVGEREVGFALEVNDAEQVPVIAEARHHGIFGQRVERRVIAAERQQELRLLEPHEVRKSAGELAIAREQPGVIGELRLNGEEAFGAGEAGLQRELDIDEGGIVGGQRHARHAEQADFDAAIERDIEDGGDVDDLERGAAQSGGEPEGAAAGGRCIAEGHQRLHGIVGEGLGPVERLNQGERWNGVEIVRHDEAAVVTEAEREAGEIDDGRDAERDEHAAQNCDGGVAVRAGNLRVSADGDDADGADLDQQHAIVLDGRTGEFDQPAGDLHGGAAVAEREALEVEPPTGGVADVGEGDIDGELVHLSRESGDGHAAIDEQGNVRAGEADADLIDVDGTEAGVHADEEHAGFAIQANLEGRRGHARVVPEPDFEIDGGIGGAIVASAAAGAKQVGGDGIAAAPPAAPVTLPSGSPKPATSAPAPKCWTLSPPAVSRSRKV